jgi:hypothetical protein
MAQLALLAVTKMLSGVCIGGVPPAGGPWIRPVKAFGTLLPGDIRYLDGTMMAPFDIVELNLLKHRPSVPHVEDWTCEFVRPRPRRVRHLPEAERRALLETCLDAQVQAAWEARKQSLALLRPSSLTAHFSLDPYSSRCEARLSFPGCGQPEGCSVTDLRWRALGRRLLGPEGGERTLSLDDLRETLRCQEVYVAVGLSRSYQGQFWPIVIGIHCLPDYPIEIDPQNL